MKKIVTISGKEFSMKSSAYIQFKYKNDTGRKLLDDIQQISELKDKAEDISFGVLDDVTEQILRIAYTMIEEADPSQVKSFEDFLKGIDGLYDDLNWIGDVVEVAVAPLSRGIQGSSPQNR